MAKSKSSNNVFTFINVFSKNLESLEKTQSVSRPRTRTGLTETGKKTYSVENEVISYSFSDASALVELGSVFLSEFKEYLIRCDFTKSKTADTFVGLKLAGYSDSYIAEQEGIKPSGVRIQCQRLTKKIYESIWGSENIPADLVYLSNIEVVKNSLRNLRSVSVQFSVENMFPFESLKTIKSYCKPSDEMQLDETSEDYFKAFRFITMFATATFEDALNDIDPYALDYVISALARRGNNFTSRCFSYVMNNPNQWLNSNAQDFRDMLIKNKEVFAEDEESKKRKVQKIVIDSYEPITEETDYCNTIYAFRINQDNAKYLKGFVDAYESKYGDVADIENKYKLAMSKETDLAVSQFFEKDLVNMSLDEFSKAIKTLNFQSTTNYVKDNIHFQTG